MSLAGASWEAGDNFSYTVVVATSYQGEGSPKGHKLGILGGALCTTKDLTHKGSECQRLRASSRMARAPDKRIQLLEDRTDTW